LLAINGAFYYLVGAVPALVTRRVWLLMLSWVAMAVVGLAAAWLAFVLAGWISLGGPV